MKGIEFPAQRREGAKDAKELEFAWRLGVLALEVPV
jgi:hypothetical protein